MTNPLTLKVNCTIGTDISEAAVEACKLANKLQVCVEFDFNGCRCLSFPGGDPEKLVKRYRADCAKKKPTNLIKDI